MEQSKSYRYALEQVYFREKNALHVRKPWNIKEFRKQVEIVKSIEKRLKRTDIKFSQEWDLTEIGKMKENSAIHKI